MTNELATYTPPSPAEWQQTMELVKQVATTEFVPVAMRGKPGAVLASIMTGRELGIGPMQSLKHIRPVEGTPGLSAELMAGLVRSRGHKLRIITRAVDEAEVEGIRSDDPGHPLRVTWTLKDAERAGLCKISEHGRPIARSRNNQPMPWEQYPDALLLARAISAVCRALFSDVLAGFGYTPEELEASNGQTETTWGAVEVDQTTGEVLEESPGPMQVTTTPAGPGANTSVTSIPTLDQIKRLRTLEAADKLIKQAGPDFSEFVARAIGAMHSNVRGLEAARDWWSVASPLDRREVLEYAVELHEQQQYETSPASAAPLPDAGDTKVDPALEGEAGAGSDQPTLDGEP